jgi:hypothetical protein
MKDKRTVAVLIAAVLVGLLCPPATLAGRQKGSIGLPGRLEEYVKERVNLTPEERTRLLRGEPVTKLLPADRSKELSVFGAVWINAPMSNYITALKNIEQFEKGSNFLVTKRISNPPRLEDFNALILQREDVENLKTCAVGDCELKLSADALQRIHKEVDWSRPLPEATTQVEALVRNLALDYVNRYLEGGNAELAAYRDSDRPTFVAQEFKTMIDQMPSLTEYLPQVKTYLLDFPSAALPNAESFLYWQSVRFGLKPTIRLNHVVIAEQSGGTVVASKMLYANHYFWTALELRGLVPDPARGEGFWFVNINRSRSDGLSGFVGAIIRGKVRGETERGMEAALRAAKARLERR